MIASSRIRENVTRAVIREFLPRFIPGGRVLWANDGFGESALVCRDGFSELGIPSAPTAEFPSVVIYDRARRWLVLVDVAALRGQMTAQRCEALKQLFGGNGKRLVFVNAFASRRELQELLLEFPWWTSSWFADEPQHMIHFDGEGAS